MIYCNYGGLRLFTFYLPPGGATLFVVTSVDKVNAQSVNENRRLRRAMKGKKSLENLNEKEGRNGDDNFVRDKRVSFK